MKLVTVEVPEKGDRCYHNQTNMHGKITDVSDSWTRITWNDDNIGEYITRETMHWIAHVNWWEIYNEK